MPWTSIRKDRAWRNTAMAKAGEETVHWTAVTWFFLKGLVTQRISHKIMGGPVAIAQISSRVGREGLKRLLWLCAVLQINLAILNLLPIPWHI